ncbi:MAG: hypothetical protein HYU26_00135 [Candidatus Rokubacteria bacterium]|nr:hypothetical protein [Candidatus Rokubacteria bacterium]
MKIIFWLLVAIAVLYGFYSGAMAIWSYMEVQSIVEEVVTERGVRSDRFERATRVKEDILKRAATSGVRLDDRALTITDEGRAFTVLVRALDLARRRVSGRRGPRDPAQARADVRPARAPLATGRRGRAGTDHSQPRYPLPAGGCPDRAISGRSPESRVSNGPCRPTRNPHHGVGDFRTARPSS